MWSPSAQQELFHSLCIAPVLFAVLGRVLLWICFGIWVDLVLRIVRAESYMFKYGSKCSLKCKSKVLASLDHFLLSHLSLQMISLRTLGFVGSLCALFILAFSYTIINIFNGDFWKMMKRKEEGESNLISETFLEMQVLISITKIFHHLKLYFAAVPTCSLNLMLLEAVILMWYLALDL